MPSSTTTPATKRPSSASCARWGDAYADPNDKTGKAAVLDVAPVKKLARPVTLAEIKADPAFKDFALVRIPRLSVMPGSAAEWRRIEKLATSTP